MFKKSLAGALFIALAGCGNGDVGVHIHDAWIRLMPGELPSAGYFVLENHTDRTITLTGASTKAFSGAMMHQSVGGTMRHVHAIEVAPGGQLRFAAGGYHLMLMPPHDPLQPGDRVLVVLKFADGTTRNVTFLIKGMTAHGADSD